MSAVVPDSAVGIVRLGPIGADVQRDKSVGRYRQANLLEDLPDTMNKTLRLALNGTYQLDKKSRLRLDLIQDRQEM